MGHAANSKKALCFARSASVVTVMAVTLFALASAAFADPKFKPDLCPADQAAALAELKVTCGYLVVPENRTKHNGRKIRLPVAIIPSKTQPALPDPVVYMAGGPGANAISQASILVAVGLNQTRDLIIMNQRGVPDQKHPTLCLRSR
jgi:hypothetical protein